MHAKNCFNLACSIAFCGLILVVPYGLIIWNIAETSNAIDSFPSKWTALKDDETCSGEWHLRVFVVGALVCSCTAALTLNLISVFGVVWSIIGQNWMATGYSCESTDSLLWNTASHSKIVLWVNFVLSLVYWIFICLRVFD